ncbi:thioredoxin family protein [Persicitalea jodogahamensis]|uniref:Thioredoxin domain-containing protein n=1 Tax=Persicitalea jodogahamensis TaxID=402147 RepID=A0A8J3D5H9_9BACT|nr:thioredoxin family protein [Persicitalea jodogahamensis]GHB56113.1 hypothetical protein GCM10007390_06750 [Persicitalea jodogahamensis]
MRGLRKTGLALIWVLLAVTSTWAAGPGDVAKPTAESGIQFTDEAWAAIVKKAKAENKIIFLDAYASWCGPCKLLQKNVFTRSDVGELFNKNFINVKVDMERGEGPQLSRLFPLEAYPTLFFIEPSGKIVRKVIGYRTPEQLIALGKSVLNTL